MEALKIEEACIIELGTRLDFSLCPLGSVGSAIKERAAAFVEPVEVGY